MDRLKLKAVLGSHPHVKAVKSGELRSDLFDLDFVEYTPTNTAFKPMVREQAFDVCEMAIVTFLMAKAHGKPLVLLPATMTFEPDFVALNQKLRAFIEDARSAAAQGAG